MSNSVGCHRTRRLQVLNAARGQRGAGSSQRPLRTRPHRVVVRHVLNPGPDNFTNASSVAATLSGACQDDESRCAAEKEDLPFPCRAIRGVGIRSLRSTESRRERARNTSHLRRLEDVAVLIGSLVDGHRDHRPHQT